MWADWSSAAGWPAAERREAHSSHLWAEGESAHGLPGAVSDEYGQFRSPLRDGLAPARGGFLGSAGDSEPHRICAAVRQAVSGGMLVMRAGAGSFCGRLLNGQGRRPCRRHRWNWLKAIIKGGGLPALLSLLWESGDAGTEIKRPPCGFTFPKEVEADT